MKGPNLKSFFESQQFNYGDLKKALKTRYYYFQVQKRKEQICFLDIPDFSFILNSKYNSIINSLEKTLTNETKSYQYVKKFFGISNKEFIVKTLSFILERSYINQEKLYPEFKRKDDDYYDEEFRIDWEIANNVISDFNKILNNNTITLQIVCELSNYNSTTSNDKFSDFNIRKILHDEKHLFLNQAIKHFGHSFNYKKQYKFGLVLTEVINHQNVYNYNNKSNQIITSLRLLTKGDLRCNEILVKIDSSLMFPGFIFYLGKSSGNKQFKLKKRDINRFEQIYKCTKNIENIKSPLKVSISRFNMGYDRIKAEDKIIDFSIAFEALFTKKEEGVDSISYKLKTRICRLIEDHFDKRLLIAKEISEFYGLRSGIVHGDSYKINKINLEHIEEYLRTAMTKYIEEFDNFYSDNEFHNKFINKLDFS